MLAIVFQVDDWSRGDDGEFLDAVLVENDVVEFVGLGDGVSRIDDPADIIIAGCQAGRNDRAGEIAVTIIVSVDGWHVDGAEQGVRVGNDVVPGEIEFHLECAAWTRSSVTDVIFDGYGVSGDDRGYRHALILLAIVFQIDLDLRCAGVALAQSRLVERRKLGGLTNGVLKLGIAGFACDCHSAVDSESLLAVMHHRTEIIGAVV